MTEAELKKLAPIFAEKIQPVEDVIIAAKVTEEKTAGGILMAKQEGGKVCLRAYVLAVGPGVPDGDNRSEMPCKAGDWVLVSGYAGLELGEAARQILGSQFNGSDVSLMRACDILAVCP